VISEPRVFLLRGLLLPPSRLGERPGEGLLDGHSAKSVLSDFFFLPLDRSTLLIEVDEVIRGDSLGDSNFSSPESERLFLLSLFNSKCLNLLGLDSFLLEFSKEGSGISITGSPSPAFRVLKKLMGIVLR
jgi:hypothetical protein